MDEETILSDFKSDLTKNLWQLKRQGCRKFVSLVQNIKPPKKGWFKKQEVGETVFRVIGMRRDSDFNLDFGVSNDFPERIKAMQEIINSVLIIFNKK